MRTIKTIIAAAVLAGALAGAGVVPAGAAPAAGSQVVKPVTVGTEWVHPGYETNSLFEDGKAVVAYRSFWVTSTKGKPIYVLAGTDLHYGKVGRSKTVSHLSANGTVYMVKASVKDLNKKAVSIPMGRAKVLKGSKVYELGYKGKVAGKTKAGESLTIYSLVLNGRTLVEFRGERGWVKTSTLKAQTASVRKAASDAKLYFPHDGVMKKAALRMKKGSTFFVSGEVESKIKGSSVDRKFVRSNMGWIKRSDSVLIDSRRSILSSSVTKLG